MVDQIHKEVNEDNPNIWEADTTVSAINSLLVGFPQNCSTRSREMS